MNTSKSRRKISIIGCGFVGSTIAYSIMMRELADEIILIDINNRITESEAMDIKHGIPYMGICEVKSGDYPDIVNSDLIIVTAGRNRKPGESRLDLAEYNVNLIKGVCKSIKEYYNSGIILVVTNPVDIITAKVEEYMSLPKGIVFGTGCILDSSRFANVIAERLSISPDVVNAQIIGEHGSSQIAMWSKVTIAGQPINQYCNNAGIVFNDGIKKQIENTVKEMGAKIIAGKGKTHYGIATCVCYIADAILNRRATIVSVSSVLHGEYGIDGVALSIPSIISSNGIERTLPDYLNEDEFNAIKCSYLILKKTLEKFDN